MSNSVASLSSCRLFLVLVAILSDMLVGIADVKGGEDIEDG